MLTTRDLIVTGITLGILHVVTGLDHMSALAALSAGNSSCGAMTLGIRWGLGHSIGLILVAIIFISLKGDLDLRRIGRFCDILLGIFMITIGLFGVAAAVTTYKEKRLKRNTDVTTSYHSYDNNSNDDNSDKNPFLSSSASLIARSGSGKDLKQSSHEKRDKHENHDAQHRNNEYNKNQDNDNSSPLDIEGSYSDSSYRTDNNHNYESSDSKRNDNSNSNHNSNNSNHISKHNHDHDNSFYSHNKIEAYIHKGCERVFSFLPFIDMRDPFTQKAVSFFIGILHGFAGPGAILGVLPAVEMQSWRASTCYLGSFTIASTLSMVSN